MKRIFLSGFCLLFSSWIMGQQFPQFTQFMQTGNVFNPAMTGISKYTDVRMGYRKQWAGLPNSPSTFFASGSGQFGIVEPSLSLPVRGRLASQFQTEKPPVKAGPKHSLGGFIMADRAGQVSFNTGNLAYALHIPIKEEVTLALGAGVSVMQSSLDRDGFNVDVRVDPGVGTGMNSRVNPDVSLGAFLYGKKFFAGYSATQLLRNEIFSLSDNNTVIGKQRVHHYGVLGAKFALGADWSVVPSFMVKYTDGAPASLDANFRVNYREAFWFGPAFRNGDAFSVLAGMHLSDFISLSYSYDYTYSKLNFASNGSHEVILGLRLVRSGANPTRPTLW
jgi:type IX secretion system PorP/SprF family membrane protein